MDSTVIATSLPAIAVDIGTNPLALKLAVTSYLLSLAVFIPASGWTADRFGARTVFRAAIAVFVIGSIGCAISSSLTDFVIARIVQGMGGAMMTPVGRLIMVRSIPKREFVGAMAWVTTPALIGPVVGPPIGGFITTYASWHWIFLINVPIGIAGIILASRYIEDVRAEERERFDALGLLLAGLGIAGLAFGLSVAGLNFLPWWIVALLIVGGAFFTLAYLWHAKRTPNPALDLTLFRLPTFYASVVGGFLFRLGVGALPFLLPLMLQVGFGMNPFQSGLITFAAALGALSMKIAATTVLRKFGFRTVLVVNGLIATAFLAACAGFNPFTPVWIDDDHPPRRRLLSLAGIHQHQHHCLRRSGKASRQQGDRDHQRRPAIVAIGRRCGRRIGGGSHDLCPRDTRHAASRRLSAGVPHRRVAVGDLGAVLYPARARRRRGIGEPDAKAVGKSRRRFRPARQLETVDYNFNY